MHHAPRRKDIWRSPGIAPPFLSSAQEESERSASLPCRSTPGETAFGTHWIGGWVGPRFEIYEVRR
jgi:hypothetical protein